MERRENPDETVSKEIKALAETRDPKEIRVLLEPRVTKVLKVSKDP